MRIIFLNAWFGITGKKFEDFLEKQAEKTDIFCLQEVQPELFDRISLLLPNHRGKYLSEGKKEVLGYIYGQAIFFRKDLTLLSFGKVNLYQQVVNDVGFMQNIQLEFNQKEVYLGNIHGKARPGNKLDTPIRLRQSEKVIDFFKDKKGAKIIGGDFNLLPQTKSIGMFEEAGYKNLIKDFKIAITRNRLIWDHLKKGEERQYFADYVFVSPEVKVKAFSVPNIEISDHLPLILDFEI